MAGYTTSNARAVKGTTLGVGATPVIIGEIKDYGEFGQDWDLAEVTNSQSAMAEFVATVLKAKTTTYKGNWVATDAGQEAVETAFLTGLPTSFTLQFPIHGVQTTTGDKWVYEGIVKSRSFGGDVTKAFDWSIEVQPTGTIPVFTPGT